MTRFKVEELCFDLPKGGNAARFRADPDGFLAGYRLSPAEKEALKSGDIAALYRMGVLTPAISSLCRVLGRDNVTYVRELRAAAGLPEDKQQIEVLEKRVRARGK